MWYEEIGLPRWKVNEVGILENRDVIGYTVTVELAGVANADFVCEMHKEGIGRVGTVCQTSFGDEIGCCID
jgi:hypothetical protein